MNKQIPRNLSPLDLKGWLQKDSANPVLIDVREEQELAIAPFPAEVLHFPLSDACIWIKTFPKKLITSKSVVVICHSGIRSWNFGTWLIDQGWGCEVWNLEGGIDAWSVKVDPTVPRY